MLFLLYYAIFCLFNGHLELLCEIDIHYFDEMFRFKKFRRTLDAEMKGATKCGVGQASKTAAKAEITEEEKAKLWDRKLLGCNSAELLLSTVYYSNGKLFGLRVGEHR